MSTAQRLRATIAALMQETGQSQGDLALALRVTQATISRKQGKHARWTLNDCDALAAHFGITVAELISGADTALNALARNRRGPNPS